MKGRSLDAICAKLQRSSAESAAGDDDESRDATPAPPSSAHRRKNFKPQLVRGKDQPLPPPPASPPNQPKSGEEDEDGGSLKDMELGTNLGLPRELSSCEGSPLPTLEQALALANPAIEHYILRFTGPECGAATCAESGGREHFHCKHCRFRLISRREEMLRHYKWHRKREESLSHGFMRYAASESCAQYFGPCAHAMRQTHYHCLQAGCDKVYISTSDVQMHANSHRKAAHIAREGFQRFKASESCGYPDCPFSDSAHRTTHFHCLRPNCTHSFKNKADMGCDYVLHSTSQMYSHKRKHEKMERGAGPPPLVALQSSLRDLSKLRIKHYDPESQQFYSASNSPAPEPRPQPPSKTDTGKLRIKLYDPLTQGFVDEGPAEAEKKGKKEETGIDLGLFQQPFNLPLPPIEDTEPVKTEQPAKKEGRKNSGSKWHLETWQKYITRYTANDPCVPHCTLMYKDHYHCTSGHGCQLTFRGKEGVREHARQHQLLDAAAEHFTTVRGTAAQPCPRLPACTQPHSTHYHCNAAACLEVIGGDEGVFRRLEHFKVHEYSAEVPKEPLSEKKSPKRVFKKEEEEARKGRPRTLSSPTQFPTLHHSSLGGLIPGGKKAESPEGFTAFQSVEPCPDVNCKYTGTLHFHCSAPRCYFAAPNTASAESHAQDFHGSLEIPEGFACFDREVACAFGSACPHSAKSRHFHCLRPACPEAFLKVNALATHAATHPALPSPEARSLFPDASPAAVLAKALLGDLQEPPTPPPYSVEQNCGRPFCKLKRRVHYHCATCSQGFSNASRLLPHLHKHGLTLPPAAAGAALIGQVSRFPTPFSLVSGLQTGTATTATASTSSQPSNSTTAADILGGISFSQSIETLKASIAASVAGASGSGKMKFHMFQPQLLKYATDGKRLFEETPNLPDSAFPGLFPQKGDGKRKRRAPEAAEGAGPKKFKFVDCTQDAVAAVEAANRAEDVAPEGFARFGSRSDCGLPACTLNGLLHYHCLHPPCKGLALPDKALAPAHLATHATR